MDEDYGKSAHRMTPVDTAPYYGIRTGAWHLTTLDGCRINTDMQVIREDGTLIKNKPGDFALVLHVRPEGWELVPVEAGPEELDVFIHLRAITDYTRTHSKKIIHAPVAGNRIRKRRANSKES